MPFIPYNAFLANKIQHLGLHLVRVLGLAGRLLLGTTIGPMVFVFYLSDVWLNVNPNTNIEGKCVFKRLNYVLDICWSFMTHIQIIGGTIIWPCNKKKNLHFDNESNIHATSKTNEKNDHGAWFGVSSHLKTCTCFCVYHNLWEVGAELTLSI